MLSRGARSALRPPPASLPSVDLEEHSLDPVIERTCAECGATLTEEEIIASLESGGAYLCSVHAAEEVPLAEDQDELDA